MRNRHLSLRVLFVTFFREKKVEKLCCSTLLLLRGERAFDFASLSLSLAFSFAKKNTLECSFVVYRLSDCVWWCCAFALASYVCFLFGSGEGAFFPFMYRRRAIYVLPHTKAKLSSLLNLFLQILSRSWWWRWRSRRSADFSQTLTLALRRYFPLLLTTNNTPTQRRDIYIYIHNNAAFPRAIP